MKEVCQIVWMSFMLCSMGGAKVFEVAGWLHLRTFICMAHFLTGDEEASVLVSLPSTATDLMR